MLNDLKRQFFELPNITLDGASGGEGPLVIYLHGVTANWAVWTPHLARMQDRSFGVAVTQRGHGKSDKPAIGYSSQYFVNDVISLIEHLDRGPALLVGHSLGARNAVLAAHRRPNLVSGILSMEFAPTIEREQLAALAERVRSGNREFGSMEEIWTYLFDRYSDGQRHMPVDAAERRVRHGYSLTTTGGYLPLAEPSAVEATVEGLFEAYIDAYREIKAPLIALRGEYSALVSEAAFSRAQDLRPDVLHEVVPEVGHYIPEEAPDVIVRHINSLLGLGGRVSSA